MQDWVIIDEKYLDYLRAIENRIPLSDYGTDKFKPFFGVLFEVNDLVYVTQISHAQERHKRLKNNLDFYKIFLPDKNPTLPDRLVAVINLNYMFPVPKSLIKTLEYKDIDQHRTFNSLAEKSAYIDLLNKEMAQINTMDFENKAKYLYELKQKFPNDPVAKRCVDFVSLEVHAAKYDPRED